MTWQPCRGKRDVIVLTSEANSVEESSVASEGWGAAKEITGTRG